MANRPSESRYAQGGKVKYLVYSSPQPLRNGRVQERTRVQRLYFPANARNIGVDEPGAVKKRTGRRVNGVAVHYRYQLAGTQARGVKTKAKAPQRWADRTKVIELPSGAKRVKLTDRPPQGARVAVT
jgi:hypothetical protein